MRKEEFYSTGEVRKINGNIFKQCINDAKDILKENKMQDTDSNVLKVANSLFKHRAKSTWMGKTAKGEEQ